MNVELTREQYLNERLSGKNRNQIALQHGYKNSGGLYVQLQKWGLKDPAVEEAELEKLRNPEGKAVSGSQDTSIEVHVERSTSESKISGFITIHIPIPSDSVQFPEALSRDINTRSKIVTDSLDKLLACVAWVTADARDLIGTGDIASFVQAYMDRQLTQVTTA